MKVMLSKGDAKQRVIQTHVPEQICAVEFARFGLFLFFKSIQTFRSILSHKALR